jgi:hypothetical protein
MADGITRIAVEGFKSIVKRQEIEIAPLTILAGANSSGKSSIMQPLLMLKQTLEATYDPGPLKIDGPNVKFTSSHQFLSKKGLALSPRFLRLEIMAENVGLNITFVKREALEVLEETFIMPGNRIALRPEMSQQDLRSVLDSRRKDLGELSIVRDRFLLSIMGEFELISTIYETPDIQGVIHVPGLRGNPLRTYQRAATGPSFPGTFEHYVASLIWQWQSSNERQYVLLNRDLSQVGLAGKVVAKKLNDVELDLQVNRLADPESEDLISVADVGFGVSQTLPVLVALRTADEGQLVYLEEPEIHLHPRAQTKLADILADAAKRGVRVVAETHSSLLLRAIQTLVAKGDLDPELVRLHWFTRDSEGATEVKSAKLDSNGAFGDWPEDFDDVALDSEQQYLDAVEDRIAP